MPLTADIESSDRLATVMRVMAPRATGEISPSRDGIPAKTSPVGYEGVWPINASFNAGTVASKGESSNRSLNTGNAERSTDVKVDEERIVDIANGDTDPGIVIGASRNPVLPTEFEGDVAKLKARLLAKGANNRSWSYVIPSSRMGSR